MHDSLFKGYNIRGKVNEELMLDQVYNLANAIAYYFLQQAYTIKTVVIGKDTRAHSDYIEQELVKAFTDSGINVILIGACATPVVSFSAHVLPVEASIMITASHNSLDDNGFKISIAKEPLLPEQITEIKQLYKAGQTHKAALPGSCKNYPMTDRYISWLAHHFKYLSNYKEKILIDCGYGTASLIVPRVLALLQCPNIQVARASVAASPAEIEPDPTSKHNREYMQQLIQQEKPACAVAFDMDADRMVAFTSDGSLVLGDKLIALYCSDMAQKMVNKTIIYDAKCSALLPQILKEYNIKAHKAPAGNTLIRKAMKEHNAMFAGELSCHFFFKDRYFGYDDGIYALLRLLELLHNTGKSLTQLLTLLPTSFNTPEIRIACPDKLKGSLVQSAQIFFAARPEATVCTLDGVQVILPYGWGIVRDSHTQPVVSLRFESSTPEGLDKVKHDFYMALKDHLDPSVLKSSLML